MDEEVADPDEECVWLTAGRSSTSGQSPSDLPTSKETK